MSTLTSPVPPTSPTARTMTVPAAESPIAELKPVVEMRGMVHARLGSAQGRAVVPVSRRALWGALACVTITGVWAFWPLGAIAPHSKPATDPSHSQPGETRLALDTAPFSAPLWMAPPPPPAPPPKVEPPAPPPPLKLQLLAIMGSGEDLSAVLYDPDADRVLVRKAGESAAGATVQRIASGEIELVDRAGSRTLALRPGGKP